MANISEQFAHFMALSRLTNPWWFYIILGVVAGIVSGLLGLGAGVVVVPSLVIICAMPQKSAQGTALSLMVPMALLGAFRYWRNPDIEVSFSIVLLLICGSILGVLIGTELAARLPAHVLRKIFAVFLVIVAVRMYIGPSKDTRSPADKSDTPMRQQNPGETVDDTNQ